MKMPKRFTDTDIWEKEWFMSLSPDHKCLVKYVRDKCDIAGVWKPNYTLASYVIGSKVTEEILLGIDEGKQFQKLPDNKILCVDFVRFQYGSELNPNSPIHKKVLEILERYDITYGTKEIENKSIFTKPTQEEVEAEMKLKIDEWNAKREAIKFINYYESVGWSVGKHKMKSWKHAVAGWLTRAKLDKPPVNTESIKERLKSLGNKKISEL